jgi:hypothetical protein
VSHVARKKGREVSVFSGDGDKGGSFYGWHLSGESQGTSLSASGILHICLPTCI